LQNTNIYYILFIVYEKGSDVELAPEKGKGLFHMAYKAFGKEERTTCKCACDAPSWYVDAVVYKKSITPTFTMHCRNCRAFWNTKSISEVKKVVVLDERPERVIGISRDDSRTWRDIIKEINNEEIVSLQKQIERKKEEVAILNGEIQKAETKIAKLEKE